MLFNAVSLPINLTLSSSSPLNFHPDKLLTSLLRSTNQLMAILDTNFNYLEANSKYLKYSGYTRKELMRQNHFSLFPQSQNQQLFEKARQEGKTVFRKTQAFGFPIHAEKGAPIWNLKITPVKNSFGFVDFIILNLEDVTKDKLQQEQLKKAKNQIDTERSRWLAIIKTIPVATLILDKYSQQVFLLNHKATTMFHHRRHDISLKDFLSSTPHSRLDGRLCPAKNLPLIKALSTGKSIKSKELLLSNPSTRKQTVVSSMAAPILNSRGEVLASVGVYTDISRRLKIEKQLNLTNSRLNHLLHSSQAVIYSASLNGQIKTNFISDNVQRLTGFPPSRFTQDPNFWVSRIHPKDRQIVQNKFQSISRNQPYSCEYRFLKANKRYIWMRDEISILSHSDNGRFEAVGYWADITKTKRLDQAKDEFLNIASHELKTPLTSIKAFTQLIQRVCQGTCHPDMKFYQKRVVFQVDKLTHLINDFLDVTKIQSNRIAINKSVFSMGKLVDEVVEDINRTLQQSRSIVIQHHSRSFVRADRYRISQVLANLLMNALDYSPSTSKVIVEVNQKNNETIVRVQDFGIGIPKSKQKKIFGRFYQAHKHKETTGKFSSLGLGLYISHQIVKLHHGKIWFESRVGEGSTFFFSLPANSASSTL
jgi:PAS domain S-box-containing protein